MSEHSIEELERQCEAARGKFEAATEAYNAAKYRLQAAREEASGWKGARVRDKKGRDFFVRSVEFLSDKPYTLKVSPIKKDGEPGERTQTIFIEWDKVVKLEAAALKSLSEKTDAAE